MPEPTIEAHPKGGDMRSRNVASIWRLAFALFVAVTGVVVLPAAAEADVTGVGARRCGLPTANGVAVAVADHGATGPRHVTGAGCGSATLDFSGVPQLAEARGRVVLSKLGRGHFTASVEAVPATDPNFYVTTGTFTLSTTRGTITFDYSGLAPRLSPVVGETATGTASLVAVRGTRAFENVSGTLDAVTTVTITGLPGPSVATLGLQFTVDGMLSLRGTPPDPDPVPGPVTVISAHSGGGSGEVALDWNAVEGATGYRVLRSDTASGPFDVFADIDIVTGATTAADEVVNIWSQQHTYIPAGSPLTSPDQSPWFQLVEVGGTGERCYQVVAYNAAGAAPPSPVACGSPP